MSEARAIKLVHKEDPALQIAKDVAGIIGGIEVLNQQVLVGLYTRPSGIETSGKIIIPDKVTENDLYESKVGLVLKIGPTAFADEARGQYPVFFHDFKLKVGDWVAFRMSDGLAMQIGERKCRLIPDVHFKLRLKHPDDIF